MIWLPVTLNTNSIQKKYGMRDYTSEIRHTLNFYQTWRLFDDFGTEKVNFISIWNFIESNWNRYFRIRYEYKNSNPVTLKFSNEWIWDIFIYQNVKKFFQNSLKKDHPVLLFLWCTEYSVLNLNKKHINSIQK